MTANEWQAFGEQVHIHRRRLRLSQEALAHAIGVSRNYVSMIERGEIGAPSYEMVLRICKYLNIEPPAQPE